MLHSLRFRLLAVLMVVAILSMGLLAFFTLQTTIDEFSRFVTAQHDREEIIRTLLTSSGTDLSPDHFPALAGLLSDASH